MPTLQNIHDGTPYEVISKVISNDSSNRGYTAAGEVIYGDIYYWCNISYTGNRECREPYQTTRWSWSVQCDNKYVHKGFRFPPASGGRAKVSMAGILLVVEAEARAGDKGSGGRSSSAVIVIKRI